MLLTGTLCIPHPSAAVYHGWMETRISQDYTYKVGKELDSKVPGNGEHRYCLFGVKKYIFFVFSFFMPDLVCY